MHDVTCLGELLIDFTTIEAGASLAETSGFLKHAGGAPANVAVGVSRLGGTAAFMGMVGHDEFGHHLADLLAENGVGIRGLRFTEAANTTLAFVALLEGGEREFIFYRNPGADMLYGPADLDESVIEQGRIFHHGSISFISPANRAATLRAIEVAKANERLVSYDPNLRMNLWQDAQTAHEGVLLGLSTADILKVSLEELEFITMQTDLQRGMQMLSEYGIPIVITTLGRDGCAYRWGQHTGEVPAPPREAVDTTGAGDAFMAGLLSRIAHFAGDLSYLEDSQVREVLSFANTVAGLVVTRLGAIPAMPTMEDIAEALEGK